MDNDMRPFGIDKAIVDIGIYMIYYKWYINKTK